MNDVTSLSTYKSGKTRAKRGQSGRPQLEPVFFNRLELKQILDVYGVMVAAGEWRDYAIDDDGDQVCFSVFRHAAEMPIYRVIKCPRLARKQGAYAVLNATGQILKRGQDLQQVLKFFDKKRFRIID